MSLFLDIGQGAGIASGAGVRPFLPPLLAGALARGDLGIDFDGTDWAFLESTAFLTAVLALAVLAYVLARRRIPMSQAALGALAVVFGGLFFAGSLADGDHAGWPGLIAGAACALLAFGAAGSFLGRVRRRLEAGSADFLDAYADGIALALAGLSILVPPLGFVALAALAYLLLRGRGQEGRKYEGLRILR